MTHSTRDDSLRGQKDGECRTLSGLALHRNRTTHRLGEPAADRQAQPAALIAVAFRVLELEELVENAVAMLGWNPTAGVAHADRNRAVTVAMRVDCYFAAFRELDRVAHQVCQYAR